METIKDSLGCLAATASISLDASYGRPAQLAYCGEAAVAGAPCPIDLPALPAKVGTTEHEYHILGWLAEQINDTGEWAATVDRKAMVPCIAMVHIATQAAIDAIAAEKANGERGYIRLGDLPAGGRSRNAADGTLEAGVSVFAAVFAGDHIYPVFDSPQQAASYYSLVADGRPMYRAYGDEVGTGADGEPVLVNARVAAI